MKTEIGDLDREASGASDSTVMILTCPECATSYFVDDSRIAPAGRSVKCTSCGARWTAFKASEEPLGDEPAPETPPPPSAPPPAPKIAAEDLEIVAVAHEPAPVLRGRPTGRSARKSPRLPRDPARAKVGLWVAVAAVAAALIVGVVAFRREVVGLVPGLEPLYAGVGLPVEALVIEAVKVSPTFEAGRPVLTVSGAIHNRREAVERAPAIRIELIDGAGKALAAKVAQPMNGVIPGHATRYFTIAVVDPPAGVHDLALSFEAEAEAPAHAPAPAPHAPAAPAPDEAKPLAPGTPDALPEHAAAPHE